MELLFILAYSVAVSLLYLWHLNRSMSGTPPEALKASPRRWTEDEIRAAYKKTRESPTDVTKYLPPKQSRRYIVVGGSGASSIYILLVTGTPVRVRKRASHGPQDSSAAG